MSSNRSSSTASVSTSARTLSVPSLAYRRPGTKRQQPEINAFLAGAWTRMVKRANVEQHQQRAPEASRPGERFLRRGRSGPGASTGAPTPGIGGWVSHICHVLVGWLTVHLLCIRSHPRREGPACAYRKEESELLLGRLRIVFLLAAR
eukprot:351801-Chlamydomonas_euryale.AAC.20